MYIKQLKLLFLLLVLTACTTGSFKGESRGNTMKRYLHYCTYEIWDGFKESLNYSFAITTKEGPYIRIRLEELPQVDKLDKLIDLDITKHKAELISSRKDKYFFGEVHKENIKIGDNSAVVVSYEFNERRKKGTKDFDDYLEKVENCYIKLKDKTLVLKGSTSPESYDKTVKDLWEEFYKSYREDDSQGFRTNYGSFKWVKGLDDNSSMKYYADNKNRALTISIKIDYLDKEEKIELKNKLSFTKRAFALLSGMAVASKEKSDRFVVDGYKIEYNEFTIETSKGRKGRMAEIWLFDFTPGVQIRIVEERENYFNMHRNEINAMIKSFKFYPDLKKDR